MKLKANDTLHVSSVQADNLAPGQEFETSDAQGAELVSRGLTTEVKGEKAETAPKNKAEPAPDNKAAPAPISAASAKPARKAKAK